MVALVVLGLGGGDGGDEVLREGRYACGKSKWSVVELTIASREVCEELSQPMELLMSLHELTDLIVV